MQQLDVLDLDAVSEAMTYARRAEATLRSALPGAVAAGHAGGSVIDDAMAAAGDAAAVQATLGELARGLERLGGKMPATPADRAMVREPLRSSMQAFADFHGRLAPHVPGHQLAPQAAAPSGRVEWLTRGLHGLDDLGPVSDVRTQSLAQVPYGVPDGFEIHRVEPGQPLDLDALDPARTYVWVLDQGGGLVVAPESQPGFGITRATPDGRPLKHGDLTPTADGLRRAPARAGGMLQVERGLNGKVELNPAGKPLWRFDNESSYSFVRGDWSWPGYESHHRDAFRRGENLDDRHVLALGRQLVHNGTDPSRLVVGNYAKLTLDDPHQPAWWSYVVRQVSGPVRDAAHAGHRISEQVPLLVDRAKALRGR